MILLEGGVIALGILVSFFLKDINFLGLNFSFLNTGVIYPDFLLIFLIFFAMRKGELSGIWIGFFAGLLEDSGLIRFSDGVGEFVPIIGIHSLVYTLTGFTLGKVNRLIDRNTMAPIMAVVLIGTFLSRVIIWLLYGIVDEFNHSYSFVGPAIYTAAITPIWFTLLAWLYRIHSEDAG